MTACTISRGGISSHTSPNFWPTFGVQPDSRLNSKIGVLTQQSTCPRL